jgi:hypothetical protein
VRTPWIPLATFCLLASCASDSPSSSSTEASIVSSTAPQTESQADPKSENRHHDDDEEHHDDDEEHHDDDEEHHDDDEEHHNRWIGKFGECTSDSEEMCWEWNTQSLDHDCGPGSDHEHCWRSKTYQPYVPLNPQEIVVKPIDEHAKDLARQLLAIGWNQPLQTPASYFVTSDLGESDRKIVQNGIQAAEEYLGSYGPMRVYIIGSDEAATEPAIADYCAWAYDPEQLDMCRSDQGIAIWEIAHYRGANAFAQHSRSRSTPTQSFVIGNPALLGAADGAKIAAHEYVHIYTAAHQLYDAADLYGLDWPIWLEEGAAEFLALYLADQKGWLSFRQRMVEALNESLELRSLIPNLTIADIAADRDRVSAYCGLCFGTLQYATGQWATAWLANRTSVDTVFLEFFPMVYDQGIDQAFETTFGLTIDDFMDEFEEFMKLPRREQLGILPTP